MQTFRGIPASSGIAIGPVFHFRQADFEIPYYEIQNVQGELERYQAALSSAKSQLHDLVIRTKEECGPEEAAIFEAHIMILEDADLQNEILKGIHERKNAEAAVAGAAIHFEVIFEQIEDAYIRERTADLKDVVRRIISNLLNVDTGKLRKLARSSIVIACDLTPSDTIMLDKTRLLGFCTVEGGYTSHTAILARSLGLPAIVGMDPSILDISDDSAVILDGKQGLVHLDPDRKLLNTYQELQTEDEKRIHQARQRSLEPAVTRDGARVSIAGNIGDPTGAETALKMGAEGIGLFRTEFLFLERSDLPGEEEQYQSYRKVFEVFNGLPVILRTLDIGGDKQIPYLNLPKELNPFLGQRAIRLCLARPDIFKPQLRAALRASDGYPAKIMFPMIASLNEIQQAKDVLYACKLELDSEGKPYNRQLEVGIMVEIPSSALLADKLVDEVDFFSIGTNDLSQYTLAADRSNPNVSRLANCLHPSVLQLINMVILAAHSRQKWVGVCGEMAGEPLYTALLLGLGVDELSMNPPAIPLVKDAVRQTDVREARQIASIALQLSDTTDVINLLSTI